MAPSGYQCEICGGANWDRPETCAYYRYIFYKLKKHHDFTDQDEEKIRAILTEDENLMKL